MKTIGTKGKQMNFMLIGVLGAIAIFVIFAKVDYDQNKKSLESMKGDSEQLNSLNMKYEALSARVGDPAMSNQEYWTRISNFEKAYNESLKKLRDDVDILTVRMNGIRTADHRPINVTVTVPPIKVDLTQPPKIDPIPQVKKEPLLRRAGVKK